MPEEIDKLPDCTDYLKFANRLEWQRITFPVEGLPIVGIRQTNRICKSYLFCDGLLS